MVPSMLILCTRFNRSDIALLGDMVDNELASEGVKADYGVEVPTFGYVVDMGSLLCSVGDYAASGLCTGTGRGTSGTVPKSDVSEVDVGSHKLQDDDVSSDVCWFTKRGTTFLELSFGREDELRGCGI